MNKIKIISFTSLLLIFITQNLVFGGQELLKIDDTLPEITLPPPHNPKHLGYLGLGGPESFKIKDVKAKVLIILLFSTT